VNRGFAHPFLFLVLSVLAPSWLHAVTLSGAVLEKGSKSPIIGASLFLEAAGNSVSAATDPTAVPTLASFSADTDLKGNYQVSLPEGNYHLTVAGTGYGRVVVPVFVVDRDTRKDFYLIREGFTLPEIVVSTTRESKTAVSRQTLSKDELASVPGTGGDILRALQALPGVAVVGDLSGQLLVRGGGPQDNLYLLDRIPLAFPFHFGGIISTLNSDMIRSVDFSAGGFGSPYGNYWGGLIDVTQRDPRRDRWGGRAEVNMLLSEGLVEGPVTSNSSLAVAGRRSYLEILGGFFDDFTAIPSFGDYQVKYSYDYSQRTHWDFQAFGSDDRLGLTISPDSDLAKKDPAFAGLFEFHNGFNSQGMNYRRVCGEQDTILNTAYHYDFFFNTRLGSGFFLNIHSEAFGDRLDWIHDFDPDTRLQVGAEYTLYFIDSSAYFIRPPGEGSPGFDLTSAARVSSNFSASSNNPAFYFDQKFKVLDRKLEFSVGGRCDIQTYNAKMDLSPRLAAAWLLSQDTTLKASWGLYHQLPIQGPYLNPDFGNPNLDSGRCSSAVLGVEQKMGEGFSVRLEGYNKDLARVVVRDPLLNYSNAGTGYSRGVEFFLRRSPSERFFGWISYAFSDTRRENGPGLGSHFYDYDQPHILTLVASYKLNPGWDAGLKWRYSSGQPDTPILGATYDAFNDRYVPIYGEVNSARLPDYQRLDFSTSLTTVYDTWQWRIFLEILNVYDHPNLFAYNYNSDYTQRKDLRQLPFLPYFGFEISY
jgi:hypothetical protein